MQREARARPLFLFAGKAAKPSARVDRYLAQQMLHCKAEQGFFPEFLLIHLSVLPALLDCARVSCSCRPTKPIRRRLGVLWHPEAILQATRIKEHPARITF